MPQPPPPEPAANHQASDPTPADTAPSAGKHANQRLEAGDAVEKAAAATGVQANPEAAALPNGKRCNGTPRAIPPGSVAAAHSPHGNDATALADTQLSVSPEAPLGENPQAPGAAAAAVAAKMDEPTAAAAAAAVAVHVAAADVTSADALHGAVAGQAVVKQPPVEPDSSHIATGAPDVLAGGGNGDVVGSCQVGSCKRACDLSSAVSRQEVPAQEHCMGARGEAAVPSATHAAEQCGPLDCCSNLQPKVPAEGAAPAITCVPSSVAAPASGAAGCTSQASLLRAAPQSQEGGRGLIQSPGQQQASQPRCSGPSGGANKLLDDCHDAALRVQSATLLLPPLGPMQSCTAAGEPPGRQAITDASSPTLAAVETCRSQQVAMPEHIEAGVALPGSEKDALPHPGQPAAAMAVHDNEVSPCGQQGAAAAAAVPHDAGASRDALKQQLEQAGFQGTAEPSGAGNDAANGFALSCPNGSSNANISPFRKGGVRAEEVVDDLSMLEIVPTQQLVGLKAAFWSAPARDWPLKSRADAALGVRPAAADSRAGVRCDAVCQGNPAAVSDAEGLIADTGAAAGGAARSDLVSSRNPQPQLESKPAVHTTAAASGNDKHARPKDVTASGPDAVPGRLPGGNQSAIDGGGGFSNNLRQVAAQAAAELPQLSLEELWAAHGTVVQLLQTVTAHLNSSKLHLR